MRDLKYAFRSLGLLIKKYPLYLISEIVSSICLVILTIIPIKVVEMIVSDFEKGLEFKEVVLNIIWYMIVYLITLVITLLLNLLQNYIYVNFTVYVATTLFKKLDNIDYDFHEQPAFLDGYTWALESGADRIYNTATKIVLIVKTIIQSISVFAIIAQVHYSAVLYSIIVGILYILTRTKATKLTFSTQKESRPYYRKREYINRMFFLKDSMADIKTTNISNVMLDNHQRIGNNLITIFEKFGKKITFYRSTGFILVTTIYAVVLGIVAYISLNGLTVATFASLTIAASSLSSLVATFSNAITDIQYELTECRIPFEVLDMESKIEGKIFDNIHDDFKELKLENVSFSYVPKKMILKNINLTVKKGEKIAIIGENGAGKTTLVKLLLRLYDVDNGTIYYNDQPYTNITTSSLREKVGAVFQNSEVYSVSVAENVLLRKIKTDSDRDLVVKALKFSGLYEYVETLEDGIDTMVTREFHRRGTIFSGGQIQKLAVARGYAQGYELFILDEPSSSLDPIAEAKLYHNMLELGRDKTLIFISHRMSTTANVDRIYLFDDGKVLEYGTHEELIKIENGLYRKMFTSQSEKYLDGEENV